jgi:hypothetical protein
MRKIIILFILLFPMWAFPATYYVSNSGSGSTCSIGSPCSVTYAFANAVAGDTWLFRGGTYSVGAKNTGNTYTGYYMPTNSGTGDADNQRIIFKAYTSETPLFNGTAGGSGDDTDYATIMATNGKDYITFDGLSFQSDSGVKMARFFVGGDTGDYSSYIKIKNCTFNGGSTQISEADNHEGLRIEQAHYLTVSNNIFYNYRSTSDGYIGVGAVKSYISDHVTFENNEIYNCTHGVYNKSYGDYWTIRYNYMHNNAIAINASTNSHYQTHGAIYHNLITAFTKAGILMMASDDIMDNWTVYNNTVYSRETYLSGSEGAMTASNGGFSATGWSIYNNIFDAPSGDDYGVTVRLSGTNTATSIDYNGYGYNVDGLCGASTWTSTTALKAATCMSLASPNHDQHSTSGQTVFTNGSGNLNLVSDYALASNSPGYHAGSDGKDMGADITLVGASGTLDTTPPIISFPLPSTAQSCTSDPRNVSISVQTDEGSTCKYSTTDVAYSSMPYTFSTTGGTSHSSTVSNGCNASYTYYVRCIDGSGNANTSSTSIAYSVSAASGGPGSVISGCTLRGVDVQ